MVQADHSWLLPAGKRVLITGLPVLAFVVFESNVIGNKL
jgi:hypothetical protein